MQKVRFPNCYFLHCNASSVKKNIKYYTIYKTKRCEYVPVPWYLYLKLNLELTLTFSPKQTTKTNDKLPRHMERMSLTVGIYIQTYKVLRMSPFLCALRVLPWIDMGWGWGWAWALGWGDATIQ